MSANDSVRRSPLRATEMIAASCGRERRNSSAAKFTGGTLRQAAQRTRPWFTVTLRNSIVTL
jgi:hypothetical protein